MKLEIKHLAPYLPYSLKMLVVTGSDQPNDRFEKQHLFTPTFLVTCLNENIYRRISCLPILRPMSDLDKYGMAGEDHYSFLTILNSKLPKEYPVDRDLDFEIESLAYTNNQYLSARLSCIVFDFLFENHFDFYGLIDLGLAIDINTLK